MGLLKENLNRAQQRMKLFVYKRRTERSFEVGDWVSLRLQPHRQKSIVMRQNLKLASRFYGPFQVIDKIESVVYKLNLPSLSRLRPIFHVSCLKKKLGQHITQLSTFSLVDLKGQIQPEPESIFQKMMKKVGNQAATKVLVKWMGASLEDSSWELLWKLKDLYPHLVCKVL